MKEKERAGLKPTQQTQRKDNEKNQISQVIEFEIVNFSLPLNRHLWERPNSAPSIILYFAVSKEAAKIEVRNEDVFRQVIMFYYRHSELLPIRIKQELDLMEDFPFDEDFSGFDSYGSTFEPQEEIEFLIRYSTTHKDFFILCRDFYRFYLAFSGGAKFHLKYAIDEYGQAEHYLPFWTTEKCVPTSLPKKMLLELQYKSNERDFALMAMYSAIRSMVGKKAAASTNKAFIHVRMFGFKNCSEFEAHIKESKVLFQSAEAWNPTNHRRAFQGLLDELQERNLISWYGSRNRRCIYVSLETDSDTFAESVAKLIKSKKQKDEIGAKIKELLNDG